MELHPILERGSSLNPGLWYVMSALGDCPSVRVGHTLTYIPGPQGHSGKVYVVGGANPSGSFSETFVLDLETFSWDTCDHPGLRARYEHSAFIPATKPDQIYVFGGADQGRNHNDIQVYDTVTQTWTIDSPSGTAPSPRTYHNAAVVDDRLIVYSGGQSGADPVGDRQVHCYNATSDAWSTLNVRGDSPKPRHGHLVVVVGNKMFIHGGMSGQTFYNDLHILDLTKGSWTAVKVKKDFPSARAAHTGAVLGTDIYVFGGMGREGALDDLYKLDTEKLKWTKITSEGPPPTCRLDFAMCLIRLRVPLTAPSVQETVGSSIQAKEVLDSQLRMGSAGSVRSLSGSVGSPGSAGSQRSMTSLPGSAGSQRSMASPTGGSTLLPEDRDALVVEGVRPPTVTDGDLSSPGGSSAAVSLSPDVPHKLVDLLLVFGGMDTEGEIFDDVLVFLVKEELEEEMPLTASDIAS